MAVTHPTTLPHGDLVALNPMPGRRPWRLLALPLVTLASACAATAESATGPSTTTTSPTTTTTAATAEAPPTTVVLATTSTTAAMPVTTTTVSRPRPVHEQAWTPFATVGPITLVHPSSRVETVAFHESNHDGAQQQSPLPTAAAPRTLDSRERDTGPRGAADIVADPDVEIRAPVSGVVKRGGPYVLYCDNRDHFVVIEPDGRPGWEVKLLHIAGLFVRAGDRVEAGVTVVAPRPTRLPFESQVDEVTTDPAWPHVHVEVVDPSIPDRPSSGGGC
jgi:biotin carboxyl carrier protein